MIISNINVCMKIALPSFALLWSCLLFVSCNTVSDNSMTERTNETQLLLSNLRKIPASGVVFGHHDDTVYGIGWEGDEDRSDVKSVCGDFPGIISFDLGQIELGDTMNLDGVSFNKIRREVVKQYERGGVVSLSWHVRNPLTGGDAWDVSDTTVVKSILPKGGVHEKFVMWLKQAASFINSLKTEEGVKVPVIFRPWHEHTGSWFWWGEKLCTPEEYKSLWQMTVKTLQEAGVNNALYAYSTGSEPQDAAQYLVRYPGDDFIDILGFDSYQFEHDTYVSAMEKMLKILVDVGHAHNKVIAVTETGYEGISDSQWWTKTLWPIIEKYPISYVLVWRNARERPTHFYAPYPGQVSAQDFVEFYNHPKTLFVEDMKLLN